MKKIININSYNQEYKNCVEKTKNELSEIKAKLFDMMVYLALSGKWKEWEANQPVGAELNFDVGMLLDTGDENIHLIYQLYYQATETIQKMK